MTPGALIFLAVLIWFLVAAYNKLVGLTQRSPEAWSDVDVQLTRRTDLIPNLVETVKGYAVRKGAQPPSEVWYDPTLSRQSPCSTSACRSSSLSS